MGSSRAARRGRAETCDHLGQFGRQISSCRLKSVPHGSVALKLWSSRPEISCSLVEVGGSHGSTPARGVTARRGWCVSSICCTSHGWHCPTLMQCFHLWVQVEDTEFAAVMKARLNDKVPATLADGRRFGGVGSNFLVSRYVAGQYFAPHFDGRGSGGFSLKGHMAEFTVVLYLSDDFVGGATHYLEGQGSEVNQSVALRPGLGCAAIHRQGTVLHSGGALHEGTKYIMQFFLYYEAPSKPEPRSLTNLRWGA
jgi:hypothetical protein